MPTYSYACTECGHRFDAVQAFTDNTLEVCPRCSGRLRKLFGSVGVVFKGSGFYRTDSRAGSVAGTSNGGGKSTESSSDSSSASKSTSKSDKESKSSTPAAAAS